MKYIKTTRSLKVPADVTVEIQSRVVKVKGQHGSLERAFKHLPVDMVYYPNKDQEGEISITMWLATRTQQACLRTLCSHIRNMFKGVQKKYQYKMRLVYSHFPINVHITNSPNPEQQIVEIRNFLGEKRTRLVTLMPNVQVERSTNVKDELVLTGISLEAVSRSAAVIHQSTLVKNKDIRKFLDGIYVSEKGVQDDMKAV